MGDKYDRELKEIELKDIQPRNTPKKIEYDKEDIKSIIKKYIEYKLGQLDC